MVTKYYEKNCDILAHQLWKKAYPEYDASEAVEDTYGKLDRHITALPYLDSAEMYHSNYTYKRLDVNRKLAKAQVETISLK